MAAEPTAPVSQPSGPTRAERQSASNGDDGSKGGRRGLVIAGVIAAVLIVGAGAAFALGAFSGGDDGGGGEQAAPEATTNVDLQQGDYEEMDQLAIAKPLCKAAFRVLHAQDIGIGLARAIRAAVSGRPGGVYLDLPAKLFGQVMDAEAGQKSLVKVIDAAPAAQR